MMFELPPIDRASELRIKLQAGSEWPQALHLRARGGDVLIDDEVVNDVVLWSDHAPPEIVVRLRPRSPSAPMTVRLWNAWRDQSDTTHAWIGDAGMLIEEHGPGRTTLRCSDGFDEPSFDDLVVRLELSVGD